MSPSSGEVGELFTLLESPRPGDAAEAKARLGELLAQVKDAWLVAGLADYQATTGSARAADVLARAPAPHDRFLMDRIGDGLRAQGGARAEALCLLGHAVRRQPLWLHRLPQHQLFRDLLALLKAERDSARLVDALLVLIALLPMIPTLIAPFLPDVFDAFGRLAAWDGRRPHEIPRGQREHLQLGLYLLFHNLYGMYPCNFVDYLKREYGGGENAEIFVHTVNPMLETVRMHPLLITASKVQETDGARWKKMEHHDVLVECRRFSAEGTEKGASEEAAFRARCGTDVTGLSAAARRPLPAPAKSSSSTPNLAGAPPPRSVAAVSAEFDGDSERWFSLADACGASAVSSAPHTPLPPPTPISLQSEGQSRTPLPQSGGKRPDGGSPPEAAIEATPENTPVKDGRQRFDFPTDSPVVRALGSRLAQGAQPRGGQTASAASRSQPPSPLKKEPSPPDGNVAESDRRRDAFYTRHRLDRVLRERSHRSADAFPPVSSPRKGVPDSPVPLGTAAPAWGSTDWPLAKPRPRFPDEAENANREDREVIELSKRGEQLRKNDGENRDENEGRWEEEEACEGEDPRCTDRRHGLHMPQSTSVFDFARKITSRSRFRSQCMMDPSVGRTARCRDFDRRADNSFRRSYSCPDLATRSTVSAIAIESGTVEIDRPPLKAVGPSVERRSRTEETQTIEVWPRLHECLFSDIIRNFSERSGAKTDVSVIEDPVNVSKSPYVHIDKYVQAVTEQGIVGDDGEKLSPKEEVERLRQQLKLLHLELLYERHRREVHAFRNRRLLGRSRKNREAEEQNQALRRQIGSLQGEIDELRQQVSKQKQSCVTMEQKHRENIKYWQHQLKLKEIEIEDVHCDKEKVEKMLLDQQSISTETSADVQRLHAAVFDMSHQLLRATKKSEMGDKLIECIKRLQREATISGEREIRFREAIANLPAKVDLNAAKLLQQYREQLDSTKTGLQSNLSKMEFLQAKEVELESSLAAKDLTLQELKKQLRLVKEEYSEKLKSVEDKYQSIKRINQRMEAHCLELLQRVPQSPQTISRELTSGFSPQSSPLSASLASSEGPGPILASRVDEIRNLQVIVNAHETIEESTSNSLNNVPQDDEIH